MAKYIEFNQLAKHIDKMQGTLNDTAFATSIGLTRQGIRSIRKSEYLPNKPTRDALGLEIVYRVIEPKKPAAVTEPTKKAAKKTAKKPAVL